MCSYINAVTRYISYCVYQGKSHKDKLPRARKSHNTALAKTENCGRRVRWFGFCMVTGLGLNLGLSLVLLDCVIRSKWNYFHLWKHMLLIVPWSFAHFPPVYDPLNTHDLLFQFKEHNPILLPYLSLPSSCLCNLFSISCMLSLAWFPPKRFHRPPMFSSTLFNPRYRETFQFCSHSKDFVEQNVWPEAVPHSLQREQRWAPVTPSREWKL